MIVQKELDEPKVVEIVNDLLAGFTSDITQLQTEVQDHETRIDALEAENPEALRGLTDVNFGTLDVTKDAKVVSYNFATDKFVLANDNGGIPDAPNASNYVRQAGNWQALATTSEIAALGTDITNLELSQADQDLIIADHETRIANLELENPEALRNLTDVNFGALPDIGKDQYTVKYDFASDAFMLLPDNSGLPDAPIDGKAYTRKDEAWVQPALGDLSNTDVATPVTGQLLQYDGTTFKWKAANPPNNFPEAPTDGSNYLRNGQSASWTTLASDPGQVTQDGRLDAIEAEQITQNGDILNL